MAKRLGRRMLAVPILGVLIALGIGAAIHYASVEPAPPKDLDEYLQRELKRLQKADTDDLSESGQKIKVALGEGADVDDLLQAFANERVRRHDELRVKQEREPYPPKDRSGKIEELKKAIEVANEAERTFGYTTYEDFKAGKLSDAQKTRIVNESDGMIAHLEAVLKGESVVLPDTGLLVNIGEILDLPSLGCALRMRTTILAEKKNWPAALKSARLAVRLPGHINQGHSTIVWNHYYVGWFDTLRVCLLQPAWSASELEDLLSNLNLRQFDLAMLARAVAAHRDSMVEFANTPDLARIHLDAWTQDGDFTSLEDILDTEIEVAELRIQVWVDTARWIDANPGDLLDSKYFAKLIEKNSERIRFSSLYEYLLAPAEFTMLRDCARLKLMWLKGKRDDAFAAEAERIAAEHGLIEFKIEDGSFIASQNPKHELSRRGHTFEPYTVTLTD